MERFVRAVQHRKIITTKGGKIIELNNWRRGKPHDLSDIQKNYPG